MWRWCVLSSLIKISCCLNYMQKQKLRLAIPRCFWTYLGIKELLVRLKLRWKSLARISKMLSLIGESLLEGLIDVRLNVVLMESWLTLLVLLQIAAHVLVKALLFLVQVRLNRLVVAFALVVLDLYLGELIAQGSQTFDLRSKFLFLILHLNINPLNQRRQLLQRLALHIV